jgi:serine/threonine protein kinase
MPIPAGTQFGPYTIGNPLGSGGMGVVYEATDTRLGRVVAIKVLSAGEQDPERERGLEREGRAVARLSHAHICVLHDVGRHDGQFFLVMERLVGETLEERLRRGPLPVPEALRYAADIADALDAAHRAGILHRDLKTSNVMLTKSGPKLLDFGLAAPTAIMDNSVAGHETVTSPLSVARPGGFAGTLRYMAPERLEGRPADARSDLFAFGALFYELLSGRPAFSGNSPAAITAAILTSEPPPLEHVPPAVDQLVRRCLARNPDDRWQTAGDLGEALRLIRPQATVGSTRTLEQSRSRWPVTAIALIAAVALSLLVWVQPWVGGHGSEHGMPVIVLMDSPVPERVYDAETRREGGTNADDITDALRGLPLELHKETTSALWHREDEVLKQHPSLIMMHLSSFAEPTTDGTSGLQANAQERTRSFLGYVGLAEPRTRFVVYSRSFGTEQERQTWIADTEQRFPTLRGRVSMMHIPGDDTATFRNPETRRAVRERVSLLLNLR